MGAGRPNKTKERILAILKKEDKAQSEIAEELKMPVTTVNYSVMRLLIEDKIELKQIRGKLLKIYGIKK